MLVPANSTGKHLNKREERGRVCGAGQRERRREIVQGEVGGGRERKSRSQDSRAGVTNLLPGDPEAPVLPLLQIEFYIYIT